MRSAAVPRDGPERPPGSGEQRKPRTIRHYVYLWLSPCALLRMTEPFLKRVWRDDSVARSDTSADISTSCVRI